MNVFLSDSLAEDMAVRILFCLNLRRCPRGASAAQSREAYRKLRRKIYRGLHAAEVNSLRQTLRVHGLQEAWREDTEVLHLDCTPPRIVAIARYANAWRTLPSYGDLWRLSQASLRLGVSCELIWLARDHALIARDLPGRTVAAPKDIADWCAMFCWVAFGDPPGSRFKPPVFGGLSPQFNGRNASPAEQRKIEEMADLGGQPLVLSPFVVRCREPVLRKVRRD